MEIQKTVKATITLDNHEIQLLQKYMEWARIWFDQNKHHIHILESHGYRDETEARVDMEKVMNPIFYL